ncbi:MAG: hypoxanthine phosphoribosyltransferase [Anaerolineales bacterium]|nr:hypoxanthine phosphoribosyltransferase [Anaerolineales bacterium]
MSMHDDVSRILIDRSSLEKRIAELGAEINQYYAPDSRPLLVCVLKGAYMFLSDLTKHIGIPHEVDFMATSAYGGGLDSHGVVRLLLDLKTNILNRHVLLVEDIVDRGGTVNYLLRLLNERHPASLHICTLLNKPSRREFDIPLDYIGFDIPNEFVIGYGLDIDEMYRNLPYIAIPKKELIERLFGSKE